MFKENPLSVGTRLGYIFVLPASLYRSLSEVARLATSSLANFVSARTTHSLILIELYLPSFGRVAFFFPLVLPYIRARNARLRLVRSLCFLLPHRKENRSLV